MTDDLPDALLHHIADDLRGLTCALVGAGHSTDPGLLGGSYGYGVEVTTAVFTMRPFWWGDCQCGYEQLDMQFYDSHPHADTCFQTAVRTNRLQDVAALARAWGLDDGDGCATHCTCPMGAIHAAWEATHDHDPACPIVAPNFEHFPTGVQVRWYKYIGRDMEVTGLSDPMTWEHVIADARAHVQPPATPGAATA